MSCFDCRSCVFFAGALALSFAAGCELLDENEPAFRPTIESFTATPTTITAGSAVLLRWIVLGADSVEITPDVGQVEERGQRQVYPTTSTRYTLTAMADTTIATSEIDVNVTGTAPLPTPTPSASTSPTPTPTPAGSETPTPTPTPMISTPTPTPTPSAGVAYCGEAPSSVSQCAVQVTYPTKLSTGQCVQLTQIAVSRGCPVGFNVSRAVSFQVHAITKASSLSWRRASSSADVLSPSSGAINANGKTDVAVEQVVLVNALAIEVVDGGSVLMRFSISN